MTIWQAIVLAIIEGITEFLPISSTGHMILAGRLMGIPQSDFLSSFEIFIQLGAILAITAMYGKTLLRQFQLWKSLLIAFVPTALVGFILYRPIKDILLGNALVTVCALLVGGVILILFEHIPGKRQSTPPDTGHISPARAVLIGVAQSISVIPGVSRSAATIIGGQLTGLSRQAAVEFSFLLAIPTMAAATGYDLLKSPLALTAPEYVLLGTGFTVAFITAWIAVTIFRNFVRDHSLVPFGLYRIMLALVYWAVVLRI